MIHIQYETNPIVKKQKFSTARILGKPSTFGLIKDPFLLSQRLLLKCYDAQIWQGHAMHMAGTRVLHFKSEVLDDMT